MKFVWGILFIFCVMMLSAQGVHAQPLEETAHMIWIFFCAVSVFFMQAGFGMLEIGLTKAKNASNIIMKNLVDFSVGVLAYWIIGWALMFGSSSLGGLIGSSHFFLNAYEGTELASQYRDWFFQAVFAATAATIVSGALAGRTRFAAYVLFSVCITAFVYPIGGHWIWGGGWLSARGFHDFAGSTVVHSVGGWAALVGASLLGARKGKYVTVKGTTSIRAVPGHNLPLASLGVFILWFGWYGFNAGSTPWADAASISRVVLTTTLSAAAGMLAAMSITWIKGGKPDPSMSMNGVLAGLVGITAGAYVIDPVFAICVGLLSGVIVVFSVRFIDYVLKIDDPVGAISVHGICGAWGTLAVALFGNLDRIGTGLSRGAQLGVQMLGIVSILGWVASASLLIFGTLKLAKVLRVDEKSELMGLDLSEHGTDSYHGFQIFSNM